MALKQHFELKFFKTDNHADMSDEQLLERFRSGDGSEYFGELYNRYIPLVYGLCMKYLGDAERAEDATMGLFENLLGKIAEQDIKNFRTWLYSVAKNHCLQILRKKNIEIKMEISNMVVESDPIVHLFDESPDELHYKYLMECMEALPREQRVAIQQFFIEERSYAEVVDLSGYEMKSVKSYIQNGKRNLKNCIEKKVASATRVATATPR